MISWLKWLEKNWGAELVSELAIFQPTELNIKANRHVFNVRVHERALMTP